MVLLSVFYCSGCGRPGIPISLSIIYGNSPYFKGFAEILTAKASLFSQTSCPLPGFLQAQAGVQGQGAVGEQETGHPQLSRGTGVQPSPPGEANLTFLTEPLSPAWLSPGTGRGPGSGCRRGTGNRAPPAFQRHGGSVIPAWRGKPHFSHRPPVPCLAFSRHRPGSRVRVPSGNRKQGTPSFPAARAGPSSARVSRRRRNSFRALVLSVISTYR